ncbi:hypothetical protein CF335_g6127 [Tilletia laevis]|nr:hypothetical protein CF335_g6127 [Tilletia laevis]
MPSEDLENGGVRPELREISAANMERRRSSGKVARRRRGDVTAEKISAEISVDILSLALILRPKARPAGVESQLRELEFGLFRPIKGGGVFKNLPLSGGAILFGPPGTGKTSIVSFVAAAARVPVVVLRANSVHSEFYGETEKILTNIFKEARDKSPSAILIDELDCIFPFRVASTATEAHKAMLSQLLTELDDAKNARVVVIGTTKQ